MDDSNKMQPYFDQGGLAKMISNSQLVTKLR